MKARRWWAWPLTPAYAVGLAVKDGLRAVGVLKTRKLGWPVVSVGSLSAGGAGKTPVVIGLARLLGERGWSVDVLSRGYGREGVAVERVSWPGERRRHAEKLPITAGRESDARRFGDEPVLIARSARVPVWVGADRYAVGKVAEETAERESKAGSIDHPDDGTWDGKTERRGRYCGPVMAGNGRCVHLLDDGFQHRGLARSFDVVLVTAADLDDALLPAGNRRESLSALERADAVIIRQQEWKAIKQRVRELTRPGTPLWPVERKLRFPAPLGVLSAGLRPVAFCAIARPEGFGEMLHEAGCGVIDTVVFGDHHSYSEDGIEHIITMARALRATGLVTTEKDAVKLTGAMRKRLESSVGPLVVVELEVEFLNRAEVVTEIEERLA